MALLPPVTTPYPIQLGTLPPAGEGSKLVKAVANWNLLGNQNQSMFADILSVNLLSQFQSGQFTTCQSVLVDNQTCPYAVMLVSQETGQRIKIPPFSLGMFPITCGASPVITATLLIPGVNYGVVQNVCTTTFLFFNTPQQPFLETPGDYAQVLTVPFTSGFTAPQTIHGPFQAIDGSIKSPLITGLSFSYSGQYSVTGVVTIQLIESGHSTNNIVIWQDLFAETGMTTFNYNKTVTFPSPILMQDPLNTLSMTLSAYNATSTQAVLLLYYQLLQVS